MAKFTGSLRARPARSLTGRRPAVSGVVQNRDPGTTGTVWSLIAQAAVQAAAATAAGFLVQPSQSDLQPQLHPQTGSQGQSSDHALPVPRAQREAAWPSCLKFDGPQVRVLMACQSMTDQEMDRWCE